LRLRDRAGGKAKLDFLAALIVRDIWDGNTFHTENLNFIPITARKGILNARETDGGDKLVIVGEGKERTFLVRAYGPVVCELQDRQQC
jgi:hypothetical protein